MTLTTRQRLRAEVFELADDRCEHPITTARMIGANGRADAHTPIVDRCHSPAVEMAHIFPRGMGHTGYRDTLENVFAGCYVHARSTDDLTSPKWRAVGAADLTTYELRTLLTNYVNTRRRGEGWDV